MSRRQCKGPELLSDLIDTIVATLTARAAIDRQQATILAHSIAESMALQWGGQSIYFPKWMVRRLSERDQMIYDEFTGDNHAELARKYNMSVQWVYQIIKAAAKVESARQQIDMFIT